MLGRFRVSDTHHSSDRSYFMTGQLPYAGKVQLGRPTLNCTHRPLLFQLQAWWRGTMVRKETGGFRLPKKDKDDGKDSKGKGKDKDKRRGKKK